MNSDILDEDTFLKELAELLDKYEVNYLTQSDSMVMAKLMYAPLDVYIEELC